MAAPSTEQAEVIERLKGQTLTIPSLRPLFASWPSPSPNPLYPSVLKPLVDDTIADVAATQPSVERRLKDDIALLSALWFPAADRARSETLALFAVWLVCWDDEVDANEGDLSADMGSAQQWRNTTMEVIGGVLNNADLSVPPEVDVLNEVMVHFGLQFKASSSATQCRRLVDQIGVFMWNCAREQRTRLDGTLPDYETYLDFRLGTVGGGMLCALVEFAMGEDVPHEVAQSGRAALLERQVGILLSLLNDLLSLKKELATGCVLNAVAALLTPGKTLDEVVREIYAKMRQAVDDFELLAKNLLANEAGSAEGRRVTEKYIAGHRAIVTGTLEFTLRSPRYNIAKLLREDGSLQIVL